MARLPNDGLDLQVGEGWLQCGGEGGGGGGGNCENKTDLSPIADVSCPLLITRHTLATGGCNIFLGQQMQHGFMDFFL